MRQSVWLAISWASFTAAHGHLESWTIDGTTYPAFDPLYDAGPEFNPKRIEYGYTRQNGDLGPGVNPVVDVRNLSIACRWRPLVEPQLTAVARAGSQVKFQWLDWFINHKGPVLTYMGELPPSGKIEEVKFFKIDDLSYDPKTRTWGSDVLWKNGHSHTATIPSDLKPGTYVIRHEIIALHGAMNDNFNTRISGAQFYPQCAKIQVTGDGTATPAGNTFPGTYTWDEPGILINMFYMPNEYKSPGGPVYKPAKELPLKGPQPAVTDTGVLTGEQGAKYNAARAKSDTRWEAGVHNNEAGHPGGGGCIWEVGKTPKEATCSSTNTKSVEPYKGWAQPPGSPDYVNDVQTSGINKGFGGPISYLFDPTAPRWEERVAKGEKPFDVAAARAKGKAGKTGDGGKVSAMFRA